VKYSDLLNVVELNLMYYTKTDNTNLNILCEFLRIQDSGQLQAFYENHGTSGFGEVLYEKYMKVASDTNLIERVKNMGLYQEKYQSRYLTENDIRFYLEQGGEERAEEMAITAIKEGLTFDMIKKLTGFNVEKIQELKDQVDKQK